MTTGARVVKAARGPQLSCKGWVQEAALRMLMNNLDPEVAERPDDLVVYGGIGKAARLGTFFVRDEGRVPRSFVRGGGDDAVRHRGTLRRINFGFLAARMGVRRVLLSRAVSLSSAETDRVIDRLPGF